MYVSDVAPAGGVVMVTSYVTVHPSVVGSFIINLSTLNSGPTTGVQTRTTTAASTSMTAPSSTLKTSMTSSGAGSSTHPSGTATPEQHGKTKPSNDEMAALSLAAIILVVLVLLSLMVYAVTQRLRGKCHGCVENEKKLAKYRNGELKYISPAMVKARAASSTTPDPFAPDLENGNRSASSEKQESHRRKALAALEGSSPPVQKSIWAQVKAMAKSKVKGKDGAKAPESSVDGERTIGGPEYADSSVYNETPVEHMRHVTARSLPPAPALQDYDDDSLYRPLSPSIYSHAGFNSVGRVREHEEHYTPAPLHKDAERQTTTYSACLETPWRPRNEKNLREQAATMRDDGVSVVSSASSEGNIVEKQMRTKRRSRAYGGLPNPEEFHNVDLGK